MFQFVTCRVCEKRLLPKEVAKYGAMRQRKCDECRIVNRRVTYERARGAFVDAGVPVSTGISFGYDLSHVLEKMWQDSWVAFFLYAKMFSNKDISGHAVTASNGVMNYRNGSRFVQQRCARFARARFSKEQLEMLNDSDFEQFNNAFVAATKEVEYNYVIADGEDVTKYYHRKNYGSNTGSLGSSCMSHSETNKYIASYYAQNPSVIKLLVALDDNDKVIGRTLLWHATDGKVYYDRVYGSDVMRQAMARKAESLGYVSVSTKIFDVKLEKWVCEFYPYCDSVRYLNLETGIASNGSQNRIHIAHLGSTSGSLTLPNGSWRPCTCGKGAAHDAFVTGNTMCCFRNEQLILEEACQPVS